MINLVGDSLKKYKSGAWEKITKLEQFFEDLIKALFNIRITYVCGSE